MLKIFNLIEPILKIIYIIS